MELSNSQIAQLCRSLSVLLHAGISVSEGICLLAQEETDQPLGDLLAMLTKWMDNGNPLSAAMEESGAFPVHVSSMVRIGEETGRMEQTLRSLAVFHEERCRTLRRIKNALAYPGMILLLMLLVIGVLLVKVLPVFDAVYASLGTRLTGAAAGLLHLGQLLKRSLPGLLAVLLVVAAVGAAFALCDPFRKRMTRWYLRRFGDRGILRKFNNARFAGGLALGMSSGLPLEEALGLSGQLLSDIPGAAARCERCAEQLQAGKELSQAMSAGELLPPAQSWMLSVAIRGGNADQVMQTIADRLMEEAEEALEEAVSRVEPAMVLAASVLVGAILLAVMLPLIDIMSTIG